MRELRLNCVITGWWKNSGAGRGHACNPRTQVAESGGLLRVPDQCGLYSEFESSLNPVSKQTSWDKEKKGIEGKGGGCKKNKGVVYMYPFPTMNVIMSCKHALISKTVCLLRKWKEQKWKELACSSVQRPWGQSPVQEWGSSSGQAPGFRAARQMGSHLMGSIQWHLWLPPLSPLCLTVF